MEAYSGFASVYDRFMKNVPYDEWTEYILKIWERHGLMPRLVLDLACGTGSMTSRLLKKGLDCIGIDSSVEMLNEARKKATSALFLNQTMQNFELYGTVQAIICCCDSVNYLTKKSDLRKMFALAKNYLEPGGIFVFDVITRHKFEKIIANNSFAGLSDDCFFMQSYYNNKTKINEYHTVFFVKDKMNYKRFDEIHVQRAHSVSELTELINESNLELAEVFSELTFDAPKGNAERVFFVVKK